MKYIIKRWKEDNMEKVGFFDELGKFHILFGLAKDFQDKTIRIQNNDTGAERFIKIGDLD